MNASRPLKISSLVLSVLLLAGCITERVPDPNRPVDEEKYLRALIDLGAGYLKNGDYRRSKENLMKAIDLDPKSSAAHTTLGLLYRIQREDRLAEKHFKKAVKFDPDNSQAKMNYGAFLDANRKYKEAIVYLTEAADDTNYRNQPEARENLARCYLNMGDHISAEENFKKALGLNPRLPISLINMAQLNFDKLDYVNSMRYYRAFQNVSQQSAKSLLLGIRLARVYGNEDESKNYGMLLEKLFPGTEEYRIYRKLVK